MDRREQAIRHAINRVRARHGLPGMRARRGLSSVAAWHSRDMVAHGMLSHSSSNGRSFSSRIWSVVRARTVGEVLISFHSRLPAHTIVRAWMHSPPHRAELLAPGYRRMGVGLARGSTTTVVTADFATGR